ncbi:alpha-mannosidase [Pseudonocardiaceae bacterium YIM PH 21723]|nr:alpha-mannosidase [Pseudonocardiaceae bacterium YIM PH 21723]
MLDDRTLIEGRINRVLGERIKPAQYADFAPAEIAVWQAPDEPVPVAEALAADYSPAAAGDRWGPPWSTTWLRVDVTVPAGDGVELIIDIGFDEGKTGFQCEGLVYRADGTPVKGLNPRSQWVLPDGPGQHRYFVELGANPELLSHPMFRPTQLGDKATAGTDPLYRFARVGTATRNTEVWELVQDFEVLNQLMHELPMDGPRRHEVLRAMGRAIDRVDLTDVPGTATAARAELAEVLAKPAHASAHRITATGHAHIDSAWLWPVRETIRKVARTTANVVDLMDRDPDFVFSMSQAQQLAWIRDHHPLVFARVKEKIHKGQFVPVGGMWVESDTNMPGGEAMARQFTHGKRFFAEEFGIETNEVWLPDSFGYSAALPQLVRLSASRWFLTQKISWNQTNRFPHHTFWWEGIDGTRIFTHFPPADTYNSELSGQDLARASKQYAEKGRANSSLVPFGHGDGGGGPTREMLARAQRLADLEGSPKVRIAAPAEFFREAEAEYPQAPVWVGELYLEFHRGTYTSQAKTKQGNRRSEHLLREAELWAATATIRHGAEYPYERLDRLWKAVLLNQFHDILPGSSIAWVHREAEQQYERIAAELAEITAAAQQALAGSGEQEIVFNAAPHERSGVAGGGAGPRTPDRLATPSRHADGFLLDNGTLRVVVGTDGTLRSVRDLRTDREVLSGPGNLPQLHTDFPNAWDAWDLDSFYRNEVTDLLDAEVTAGSDHVMVVREFGGSRMSQLISVSGGQIDILTEIDWQESEKILKLAFPLDVRTEWSSSETQFGHIKRPTHANTSWDAAKFEICAHRWLHLAEPGYGVALINDSTYGHDVTRTGTTTTARVSLLRAPRYPDPQTDHGVHRFRHRLVPGASISDAVVAGYQVNLPERAVYGTHAVTPLVTCSDPDVVVEAVKLADDRSGDLVVRLYQSTGARTRASLRIGFPCSAVWSTDLLERRWDETEDYPVTDDTVELSLRGFEVLTLRVGRAE